MSELDFFGGGDLSAFDRAQIAAARDDAKAAAEEKRLEAERAAAREDRLEALQFANRQHGNPLGELSRARVAFTAADDEVRDLSAQLAKAEAKRSRAQDSIEFWGARSAEVTGIVSRSAPSEHDLLRGAKEALASMRVDAELKARAGQPRTAVRSSLPKGAGCGCEACDKQAVYEAQRSGRVPMIER